MGNRQTVEQRVLAPRSYYLVVGNPGIRYTGENSSRGPLIFNVESDQRDGEDKIQHAETLQLRVAVPSRQKFRLKQIDCSSKRFGFLLSFSLAITEPGQTLRVFAGVEVKYSVGNGVQLVQGEKSQTPFCVFEIVMPEEFQEEIELQDALLLQKLKKAEFTVDEKGTRRLTYAPIAIELVSRVPAVPQNSKPELEATTQTKSPTQTEKCNEVPSHSSVVPFPLLFSALSRVSASSSSSSSSLSSTVRMAQYTFLDIPDTTADRPSRSQSPTYDDTKKPSLHPEYEAKVVRQLLQCGVEVYELEDVFDIDGCDEDISDAEEEGSDEGTGTCIICMAYPKDTTLLPCRHMCLCHECASVLRFQKNSRCPICRANIDRFITV